jgi:hypothetical protein
MEKPGGRNLIPDAKSESCHFFYNIVKDDTPDYLSGLLPRTVNQANNYNYQMQIISLFHGIVLPYIKIIFFQPLFISIYLNISEIHLVIAYSNLD